MRLRWVCRIGTLMLGLTLVPTTHAQTSETIVVDGSTGVMPLVAALAKAYQEQYPSVTVEIGKGLGTAARLQALAEGTIDIALASHGLVVEELTRRGMAVHEIAKVAVVFGVNASVPVTNVTDRHICDAYDDARTCEGDAEIRGHGQGARYERGSDRDDDGDRRGAEPRADQSLVPQWRHPQRGQCGAPDLYPDTRLAPGHESAPRSAGLPVHRVHSQLCGRGCHRRQRCGAGEAPSSLTAFAGDL